MTDFEIQPGRAAVITYLATIVTVADINIIIGGVTAAAGLAIQIYFKMQQNKREAERHEWDKQKNKT